MALFFNNSELNFHPELQVPKHFQKLILDFFFVSKKEIITNQIAYFCIKYKKNFIYT